MIAQLDDLPRNSLRFFVKILKSVIVNEGLLPPCHTQAENHHLQRAGERKGR
jgi:hypothetical protein